METRLFFRVWRRKKRILFEANCSLGKVNRLFAKGADCLATQFPLQEKRKKRDNCYAVPFLPWKEEKEKYFKNSARQALNLEITPFTFLVFGGSQGALFLNENLPSLFSSLKEEAKIPFQVIHLTGSDDQTLALQKIYTAANIKTFVKTYEAHMPLLFSAADVAICRAGASTLAELITYQLPALLIPYPFSKEDHQKINANFFEKIVKGGKILYQENFVAKQMKKELLSLMGKTSPIQQWKKELLDYFKSGGEDKNDPVCTNGENQQQQKHFRKNANRKKREKLSSIVYQRAHDES